MRFRLSASWKILCIHGGQWKAIQGEQQYGNRSDEYNTVRFEKVTAEGLRLEIQLQEKASGGILECKVAE